jgi:elongation factor P
MADTSVIKKDVFIRYNGVICVITDFQHVNPGKGSAFVRAKFRNVQTGKSFENTFKVGESIDVVDMNRVNMQFLYADESGYNFMDSEFEQHAIPKDILGDKGRYLKDGQEVVVLMHESQPLSVDIPKKLAFEVIESSPAVKGNTASGGNMTKAVKIDNGMEVSVPMFIEQGDRIIVNTDSGEYVERAK